jgi:cadmium resistance protein CadD (predicted permease)
MAAGFRKLALAASVLSTLRIVYFRMLGWEGLHGWAEICAMIGALILFWIGTQRMRRFIEVLAAGMLGSVLLLVHELPFVSMFLHGFLTTDRSFLELLAVIPMALCLALCYFALRGMVSDRHQY